jgi:DNA mismatch repair protein MutS
MLLYGMNSSGKSTLLKSLGMAVWLAQCGFFAPVKSLQWTCLHNLFTKIGSYDNLFCGHSTFVAEMSELNYILRKSNEKTLVLCDELTSGTETRSATGIVASTLTHLVDNSILFLFTTHLHTVSNIPEIKDNPKIRICHFKVSSENRLQPSYLIDDIKIRYDRELNDGSGSDLYGIEIARSLGMSESFISKAFDFRERVELFIHDSETSYKTSRYNKNVIMQECSVCQSKVNLHTHHITPQAVFEKNPTFHDKNGKYNLLVLCEKCHEDVHKKKSLFH